MPYRRDAGPGWRGGDRGWNDQDFEGQWRASRNPDYERNRDYERARSFGRGPDVPYDAFYGKDYGRSPEAARYDAENFGGYDREYLRDLETGYSSPRERWEPASRYGREYQGYRPFYGYGGYVGGSRLIGEPYRRERQRESYVGRGPRGYRRSDERIRDDVNDRLAFHPDLDASDIDVRVANGIVTLSGVVDDRGDKRLAEDIVEDVLGVDDVNNELKVRHGLWARFTGEHVSDREVTMETERESAGITREPSGTAKRPATARSARSTAR